MFEGDDDADGLHPGDQPHNLRREFSAVPLSDPYDSLNQRLGTTKGLGRADRLFGPVRIPRIVISRSSPS